MEYQTSPFEPIRNFDVPSVLLNQLFTGQASLKNFSDTVLPSKRAFLTPTEQESLTEKLKEQYGGQSKMAKAAIGIATNPWIWLGLMVSPAGARSIKTTGSLFSPLIEKGGMFQSLGALTSLQVLNGTLLGAAVEADVLLRKKAFNIDNKHIKDAFSSYYKSNPGELKRLGIAEAPQDINEWLQVIAKDMKIAKPKKVTRKIFNVNYNGPHKELADDITRLLALELQKGSQVTTSQILNIRPRTTVHLSSKKQAETLEFLQPGITAEFEKSGATTYLVNKEVVDYAKAANKKSAAKREGGVYALDSNGAYLEKGQPKNIDPLIDDVAFQKLKKVFHIDALAQAHRKSYDERLVMLMGDESMYLKNKFEDGVFHYDENKLSSIAAAFQSEKNVFKTAEKEAFKEGGSLKGLELLRSLVPLDELNILNKSKTKQLGLFKEVMKSSVNDLFKQKNYLPRNTYGVGADDLVSPVSGRTLGQLTKTGDSVSSSIQNAETISDVNRLTARAATSRSLTPQDYDWLIAKNRMYGTNDRIVQQLEHRKGKVLEQIFTNAESQAQPVRLSTLDGVNSHNRYMKDTSETWSRHIEHKKWDPNTAQYYSDMEVYGEMVVIDEAHRKNALPSMEDSNWGDSFKSETNWRSGGKNTGGILPMELNAETLGSASLRDLLKVDELGRRAKNAPAGGVTIGDVMSVYHAGMRDPDAAKMLREVILPYVSGRINPLTGAMKSAQLSTAAMTKKFADGWMGKQIEKVGPNGKEFVDGLRNLATHENISGPIAKGLYVGFLGANMSSVMLNMMQPFLHTTMQLGLDNVIPAYGKAVGEMFNYAKERIPLGLQISEAKRAELMTKHFTHVGEGLQGDLIGLLPDVFANIEGASYAGVQAYSKEGMGKFLSMTLPMKLFEKAELMNRLVSAHAVDIAFQKTGRKVAARPMVGVWNEEQKNYFRKITDTKRFVQETQFGGTALNMPTAFINDKSPLSGVLSNSLGRQFLSFISRSFTSFAVTGKQINPDRFIRGTNIKLPGNHMPYDLMRAMGAGALVYEVGKEVFGTDLSRGLGAQPLLEVMGGGWVPPVVQLPYDLVKLSLGDLTLAETSLPAIVPGGIAAVRAMGMMPQLGKSSFSPDWTNDFQKTYVDWNTKTPEGLHPVFKADGSLINYEKPFSIIMKGLGINLGTHPKAGEVDGYLVKQRQLIVKMESDYLNAMLSNNISKAKGIEVEFKKKFGVPLKISKSQLRSRMRNLETARTERIANTIPKEYKHLYQSTLASEQQRLGITEEEVNLGVTSTQRSNAGAQRTSPLNLDPETVKAIIQHMKEQEATPKPVEEQGFNPYTSWNK